MKCNDSVSIYVCECVRDGKGVEVRKGKAYQRKIKSKKKMVRVSATERLTLLEHHHSYTAPSAHWSSICEIYSDPSPQQPPLRHAYS